MNSKDKFAKPTETLAERNLKNRDNFVGLELQVLENRDNFTGHEIKSLNNRNNFVGFEFDEKHYKIAKENLYKQEGNLKQ